MDKDTLIGYVPNFLMAGIAFGVMIIGGWKFLIPSLIFFGLGGIFEFIIMSRFYGPDVSLKQKIKPGLKILNGILWVHGVIRFIKINGTTIYDFKRLGYLVSFTSYFTMLLYVVVAFFMFRIAGFYAFILYLIPVGTNIMFFFENKYKIF